MSRGGFGRGGVRLAGVSAGFRRRRARPSLEVLEALVGLDASPERERAWCDGCERMIEVEVGPLGRRLVGHVLAGRPCRDSRKGIE